MKDFFIFLGLLYFGYFINVVWVSQVYGSLFITFPYLLKSYKNKEFSSISPIAIPLYTVFMWLFVVALINLLLLFFLPHVFLFLYTNLGFLAGIIWVLFASIIEIHRNGEAKIYAEKLRQIFFKDSLVQGAEATANKNKYITILFIILFGSCAWFIYKLLANIL